MKILIDHDGNGHCPNTNSAALSKLPLGSNFVFISKSKLAGARHGDRVVVHVNPSKRAPNNSSLVGRVAEVIERNSLEPLPSVKEPSSSNAPLSLDTTEDAVARLADRAAEGIDELDALSQVWDTNLTLSLSGMPVSPAPLSAVSSKGVRDAAIDRIASALEFGDALPPVSLDRVLVIDVGSGTIKIGFCSSSSLFLPALSG